MGAFWRIYSNEYNNIPFVKNLMFKQGDLYHNKMYTVIPKDMDTHLGILPEDQKFSDKHVFLWDTYSDLMPFNTDEWKKVEVLIPAQARFTSLSRLGGGYALPYIPNQWTMKVIKLPPQYVE